MPASVRAHLSRASSTGSRPYDRRSPSLSPSSPALSEYQESVISPLIPPPEVPDQPGLPTYAQYKRIEAAYLNSLSPRKRDKALITQAMFDKIWDVIHQPEACNIETPQFRFWVRKMFTLSQPQGRQTEDAEDDSCDLPAVVLHENRPVAVKEQLYELFCYCHSQAGHAGRDKTCAVIRQHYSWVPKELTAQFVKACPTCTLKRSGNPELVALVQEQAQVPPKEMEPEKPDESSPSPTGSWPPTGGPLDPPVVPEPGGSWDSFHPNGLLASPRPMSAASDVSTNPSVNSSGVGTHPVSREVLLVNGLPGGWDYYASPLATESGFYSRASILDINDRPSIPSVIFTPELSQEDSRSDSGEEDDQAEGRLPSIRRALSNSSLDNNFKLSELWPENSGDRLSPALRQLQISSPVAHQPSYLFQIDPVLLALDCSDAGEVGGAASRMGLFSYEISHDGLRSFESPEVEASSETDQRKSPTQMQMPSCLGFPSTPSMEALTLCRLRAPVAPYCSGLSPDSEYSDISASSFSFSMLSPESAYSPLSSALPSPTDEVGKALRQDAPFLPITNADA